MGYIALIYVYHLLYFMCSWLYLFFMVSRDAGGVTAFNADTVRVAVRGLADVMYEMDVCFSDFPTHLIF